MSTVPPARGQFRFVIVVAALLMGIGVVVPIAARLALSTRGQAFASLLVDPFGSVSNVFLPSWSAPAGDSETNQPHPGFPDRIVAIDGVTLAPGSHGSAGEIRTQLVAAQARGDTTVAITFE